MLGLVNLVSFASVVALDSTPINPTSDDPNCQYPGTCVAPTRKYSNVMNVEPRHQWGDSGGYCGSLSVQAIAESYGLWISQTVVRKSAADGGGHGNPTDGYEILHTNIEGALDNLMLTYETFASNDYPQSPAYLEWLKQKLAASQPVVWFIMCAGDGHDCYGIPNATYDHVEPVFGIYSDDMTAPVMPDDVLVHGSDYAPDGSNNTGYFRRFDSLVDTTDMDGNCSEAVPMYGKNEMYPCIEQVHAFGVAITGLVQGPTLPTYLKMSSTDEPDVASGKPPGDLYATVTVSGAEAGRKYKMYRFDRGNAVVPASSEDYEQEADWCLTFDGTGDDFVWADSHPILSNTSVAYRTIEYQPGDSFAILVGGEDDLVSTPISKAAMATIA